MSLPSRKTPKFGEIWNARISTGAAFNSNNPFKNRPVKTSVYKRSADLQASTLMFFTQLTQNPSEIHPRLLTYFLQLTGHSWLNFPKCLAPFALGLIQPALSGCIGED
ncbi:hypothetical protein Y032_0001g291 [Ancylostoma ceylanicum]|uniref:Uncharacterized protein n=1 Tax=Ancylostoma ceylanicum TaxID=53326 RepID=A0A016W2V7_9BILA|nr:hypothetical protein Y032_0001g291 [Ancylostoma ceylanicum]